MSCLSFAKHGSLRNSASITLGLNNPSSYKMLTTQYKSPNYLQWKYTHVLWTFLLNINLYNWQVGTQNHPRYRKKSCFLQSVTHILNFFFLIYSKDIYQIPIDGLHFIGNTTTPQLCYQTASIKRHSLFTLVHYNIPTLPLAIL